MAVHVECAVEKIAMPQVYFEFFAFSLQFIIPPIQILSSLIRGAYTPRMSLVYDYLDKYMYNYYLQRPRHS
jgi:hypothetical protein